MKKKLLALLLTGIFLAGCSTGGGNTPGGGGQGGGGGDTPSGGGEGGGGGGTIDPEEGNKYDAWCNSWSKDGHLYFHYNRGEPNYDYNQQCLWLWPEYPEHYEGTLWAFSGDPVVSDKLTLNPMSTRWMTKSDVGLEGDGIYTDDFGAIVDVHYKATNLTDGKDKKPVTFADAQEVGFLLPRIDSMDGSGMWSSDGGAETYITDISEEKNWRTLANGGSAAHIFVASGNLDNHTYYAGDGIPQVIVNPINNDTTGDYRSDIVDYSSAYGLTTTSEAFKNYGVGYQVFVASFRDSDADGYGDIRGVIDALPYLDEELGAEVLWLTPIQASGSYHGYDINDYYAIDKRFGTVDDYRELIYKAHQRGMKVLMDLVINHTSKSNVWFKKSQWAEESMGPNGELIKWRNVYTWKYETDKIVKWMESTPGANDWAYREISVLEDSKSQNPSWYRDGESHYYYYGKFGSGMPELNYQNAQTRELVIDMAKYWMSFGLDGFRLDAVKHIFMRDECYQAGDQIIQDVGSKRAYNEEIGDYETKGYDYSSNLTKNVQFWKEFGVEVKNEYPNCFLVGENFDGWGTRTAPYYQALDSQFDFANYFHIVGQLYDSRAGGTGTYKTSHVKETYQAFASYDKQALGDGGEYVDGGCRPDFIDGSFTSNHDVMRAINRVNGNEIVNEKGENDIEPLAKVTGTEQQINRAKIHAAVTMLSPGISWIYYGDEIGMSSNTDKHEELYTYENCIDIWYRQPMKWHDEKLRPSYRSGRYLFEYDDYNKTIDDVETQVGKGNSMFAWYKTLCEIKKAYPDGGYNFEVDNSSGCQFLIFRITKPGAKNIAVVINVGYSQSGSGQYSPNPDYLVGSNEFNVLGALNIPSMEAAVHLEDCPYSVIAIQAK